MRLVDLWEVTHFTCLSRERFQGFWRMCSINIQGQCWSFVHRDYVFTQPRSVRVSLLYLSGFCVLFLWPRCGQCCEYRVGLFIDTFLLFTSLHAEARERGKVCVPCCDRPSVISSHIVQDTCSLTLSMWAHEAGKSKMEIWPSARTSGNETSSTDSLISKAARCTLSPHNWPHHSHGPVEMLYCYLDLCC